MGGCCTSSTPLRLISNSGFHISEHGLAVLVDVWNELYYSRHIKDVWMDHLTGICFKSSHSSALAWLSWYASKSSGFPVPLLPLAVSGPIPSSGGHFGTAATRSHSCLLLWRWPGPRQVQGSDLWLAYLGSRSSVVPVAFSLAWVPDCGPLDTSPFGVAGVPMSQWETIPWISCSLDTKRKK